MDLIIDVVLDVAIFCIILIFTIVLKWNVLLTTKTFGKFKEGASLLSGFDV
jgi:hypothetical protein